MDLAQKNDIVTIHYTIRYTNGTLYDTTDGKPPITFTLNESNILPFIPNLIIGMKIGDIKTVTLKAKDAFGNKSKNLIKTIPREKIPNHINQKIGNKIEIQQENTPPLKATITKITNTLLTIDANPDMCGKDLVIKIELLDIET